MSERKIVSRGILRTINRWRTYYSFMVNDPELSKAHTTPHGQYDTEDEAKAARDAWMAARKLADKAKQDKANLREAYDSKRVEGVVMPLFKGQTPRKDSSTGYRGVLRTKEGTYYAWITVNHQRHYSHTFKTAKEAYRLGRLPLEAEWLPDKK